ncbi:MAG: DNA repair protein RecN [Acidimicrobiales bacterium]
MLDELAVTDLGVIERLGLTFGPGMTALTGETGAGKTLVVEAIDLLLGGRADPSLVRPDASEAVIEGRFSDGEEEWVLRRVLPRGGRSRGYINGALATQAELRQLGSRLVDLHGQHDHQSLLHPATQRNALDLFGGVDLGPLRAVETDLTQLERSLAALGGDDRARARELDLLRFQLEELQGAELDDPDEDARLEAEEERLADALAHQEAALGAYQALNGEDGAGERVAAVIAALRERGPFRELEGRARALASELVELGHEIRDVGEGIEPDPERLEAVRARRLRLRELCRKYGDTLADVIVEQQAIAARAEELAGHEARGVQLDQSRRELQARLVGLQADVGRARRKAAPSLAAAVQAHLGELALAKARLHVAVGRDHPDLAEGADLGGGSIPGPDGDAAPGAIAGSHLDGGPGPAEDPAGERVTFLLAANPGSPLLPLARVASGGELARTMLALRLVLARVGYTSPPTQIFDEVDAGIGGATATAVGAALARLAANGRQILVVTHLAQVAAWAETQVAVEKQQGEASTASVARALQGKARTVELARMLSGSPGSAAARKHAGELLADAAAVRATW